MKTSVFLFYKLKPDTDVEAFERRARDVEARLATQSPAIVSYALTRLEGALGGEEPAPYDYVESMEVTTLDEYQAAGEDPDIQAFLQDWERDVESFQIMHGIVVSHT
jgi:hypothetical protein